MRLTQQQIKKLSEQLVSDIEKREVAELVFPADEAASVVAQAIADDLRVEDKLNEEVKDILKSYEREIEQGRMDYKTMFDMVKKKLVRERGLIL